MFNLIIQSADFYDYYYLTTNANDIDINLYAIHGDENKPVYIFIDGNRGQVQVNLQSNSVRPVIFCDLSNTGKYSYTDWQGQKVTEYYSKFKLHANGYTFKGVVFAPYSQAFVNFDGPSTFIGSMYAGVVDLPSNHGRFIYKDYHVIKGFSGGENSNTVSGSGFTYLVPNDKVSWN